MSDEEWAKTPRGMEYLKYHDDSRADAAIQEMTTIFKDAYSFEAGSWGNEFDVYEMKDEPEPGCIVRIRVYRMWGAVTLDEIETTPECEGKGYAQAAIAKIKAIVKKHGILLQLKPKAFHRHKGEGRMGDAGLRKWYESQGFKPKGTYWMEYKW